MARASLEASPGRAASTYKTPLIRPRRPIDAQQRRTAIETASLELGRLDDSTVRLPRVAGLTSERPHQLATGRPTNCNTKRNCAENYNKGHNIFFFKLQSAFW